MSNARKFGERVVDRFGHCMPWPGHVRGGKSAKRKQRRELWWNTVAQLNWLLSWWVDRETDNRIRPSSVYRPSSANVKREETVNPYVNPESSSVRSVGSSPVGPSSSVPVKHPESEQEEVDEAESESDRTSESSGRPRRVQFTEIESDPEEQGEVEPFELPSLTGIRSLNETSERVVERRFDLPRDIGGICLFNELAVAGSEGEDISFDVLAEALRPCIILDLFKTVVFPQHLADSHSSQIALATHRGSLQVVDRRTAVFCQRLAVSGYHHCAVSYIGRSNSREFVDSISRSSLLSLIPVIFVVFDRSTKAEVAKRVDCLLAFDDQDSVLQHYHRAGVRWAKVTRNWSLHGNTEEVLQYIDRIWYETRPGSSSDSRYFGKVELRGSRQQG